MAVLMMMILLVVAAVGLLSLSTISLRNSSTEGASKAARANSRLALYMALGELQKQLGDDRRVTADAALTSQNSPRPNMVGVWKSHEDQHVLTPTRTSSASEYSTRKTGDFMGWLVSSANPLETEELGFASSTPSDDDITLFHEDMDGYDMAGGLVEINAGQKNRGGIAWAISQAATKASINTGVEYNRIHPNDVLQAPDRANIELSGIAKQPTDGWQNRYAKVLNMNQAILDSSYNLSPSNIGEFSMQHTARSLGVQADVAKGGLKKDLSLAFEMGDNEFKNATLDGGVANPFSGNDPGGESRLYHSAGSSSAGTITLRLNYDPVYHTMAMDTGAPPTLNSLRSYYRMYKYMYDVGGVPTVAQRFQANPSYDNASRFAPRGSETSVNPILDRVLLYFSLTANARRQVSLLITPVITLWNPYDVAIECEGYVAYPWFDIPMFVTLANNGTVIGGDSLTRYMGRGFGGEAPDVWNRPEHGRMAEPFFFCKIVGAGGTFQSVGSPIRIEPGQVRVFAPTSAGPQDFSRIATNEKQERVVMMSPVDGDINVTGGLRVSLADKTGGTGIVHQVRTTDNLQATLKYQPNTNHFFMSLEDAERIKNNGTSALARIPRINETQVFTGQGGYVEFTGPSANGQALISKPSLIGVLETYHRTAGPTGSSTEASDIIYTVNPRQRHTNFLISGAASMPNSHYASTLRRIGDIAADIQAGNNGANAYYGYSNAPTGGRDSLSFFSLPKQPMMSLGAFQSADLSSSAFAPSNQVGNSWASPFLERNQTASVLNSSTAPPITTISGGLGVYDHSYLLNAAIWDTYFFSSIAPNSSLGSRPSSVAANSVYGGSPLNRENRDIGQVVSAWVANPRVDPLRNTRHLLHTGGLTPTELKEKLEGTAGTLNAAAHILVDGMFNINSVNELAWRAMFASLRGTSFDLVSSTGQTSSHNSRDNSPLPRLIEPRGNANDPWDGFRELTDQQIERLATAMVAEVRSRGPFQSLSEFVNRRVTPDALGLKGALQAAIDNSGINDSNRFDRFTITGYPKSANIPIPFSGVGTPGWLTQADILTSMAPFISPRSDTFTIRAYGDSRDSAGNIIARSYCEATVQRIPEWVDPTDDAADAMTNRSGGLVISQTNQNFGRRFEIVSIREISEQEFASAS